MVLQFTLSMPSNNAWNGKWTGDSNFYARVVNFGRSKKATARATTIRDTGSFSYDFGDGWRASVSVKEITAAQAVKVRRKSKGFCGYDWIIDSIREHNTIKTD